MISLPQLEQLARDALSSQYAEVRTAAMEQLRFLSAYDHWDFIKGALVETNDSSLLFVLAKSMHFVVSNEIGPQERAEIQEFVLQLVANRTQSNHHLPRHLLNVLFSVFAAALYLNWRLMVISDDEAVLPSSSGTATDGGGSQSSISSANGSGEASSSSAAAPGSSSLGSVVESMLTKFLQPWQVVECMREILNHFAKEESRSSSAAATTAVRNSFARTILPHFLKYAEANATSLGKPALDLMCLILECAPQGGGQAPLITVNLTTDDSIYVNPARDWIPVLRRCTASCQSYVISHPLAEEDDVTEVCLRILRLVSTVCASDWSGRQALRVEIDGLGQELVNFSVEMAKAFQACRSPTLLRASVAIFVNCFERDDIAVGQHIFHSPDLVDLWTTLALSVCTRWLDDEQEARQSLLHLFYLIGVRALPKPSSTDGISGDGARRDAIEFRIRQVFNAYLTNVLSKAHLSEDSLELRCDEGFVLHSEEHLQPLAELMFCERLELSACVRSELLRSVEQYEACLRMGRGETIPEEMLLSLMVVSTDFMGSYGTDDIRLFLTNVVLSRIGMIIATVALGIRASSVFPNEPIVDDVVNFLQQLIAPEDEVTDALLQCMTLAQPCNPQQGGDMVRKLHLGVLRSLFHFAHSVAESDFGRHTVIHEGIELICYVLQRHSLCLPLVRDATLLLRLYLDSKVSTTVFLCSERMQLTLQKVASHEVALFHADLKYPSSDTCQAREGAMTTLVAYVESRALNAATTDRMLEQIVESCSETLQHNIGRCFGDLVAITEGCSSAAALLVVLDWIERHSQTITHAIRDNGPQFRKEIFRLWAALCEASGEHLKEDNINVTQWGFASLVFNSIDFLFKQLEVRRCQDAGVYYPPNVVSELEMYDICAVIISTCGGTWVNLGVMMFFRDTAVETVLLASVEVLLTIPVELLVSREDKRHKVFNAILSCLTFAYPSKQLNAGAIAGSTWPRLLEYLLRCLEYRFSHLVTQCIRYILVRLWPNPNAQSQTINPAVLQGILREVAVALSTITLAEETFDLAFDVMRCCYDRDCSGCEAVLEHLLSFCSAYHRVRIRCILMMLRTPGNQNSAKSYLSVFGVSSKVATLAAW